MDKSLLKYPNKVTTNTDGITITPTLGHAYITMIYNNGSASRGIDFDDSADDAKNDFTVGGGHVLNFGDHPLKVKKFKPGGSELVVVWYDAQ